VIVPCAGDACFGLVVLRSYERRILLRVAQFPSTLLLHYNRPGRDPLCLMYFVDAVPVRAIVLCNEMLSQHFDATARRCAVAVAR
jgi:hypothetical protein